jgi:ELWxxDGT repeat protein
MDLRWTPLCALLCALPALADPAPAYLVKDINATATSNFGIGNIADTGGGIAYLSAGRPASGTELWTTDGTPAGTRIVKDLYSGTGDSSPSPFVRLGSSVLFAATHPTTGRELWQSDGTAEGTVLLKDIAPGSASSGPGDFVILNGTLFFAATDATQDRELWKSDGTAAGTVRVKDIVPGPVSSSPSSLTIANGTLFLQASEPATGNALWKSDGTTAGTVLVKDVSPSLLTNVGGTLFFAATGQLWKSDGTDAGTVGYEALEERRNRSGNRARHGHQPGPRPIVAGPAHERERQALLPGR